MKSCPYCGFSNYEQATQCRKCDASFVTTSGQIAYKSLRVGPVRAHEIRSKALSFIVLGILIKVYWGGYGPWPVYDVTPFPALREWLVPLFMYGGAGVYALGWILNWV